MTTEVRICFVRVTGTNAHKQLLNFADMSTGGWGKLCFIKNASPPSALEVVISETRRERRCHPFTRW